MNIGAFGFPTDQQSKLEKILQLSKNNRYQLVAFEPTALPDLLLVFGEESLSEAAISSLPKGFHSRLILVSKNRNSDDGYARIGFPLVSSRVIRALDQMTHENEEYGADSTPSDSDRENLFSKYTHAATPEASDTRSDRTGYRVLVVDDSPPMQEALAHELGKLGLPVSIDFADNGEEALTQVEKNSYDFLFLDIVMPGIDGFETCTRMRTRPELKKTPIIMLSSKNSPLDEVKGIMAGCSTYLTKPINHDEFQKVINRVSSWVDEFKPQ